MSDHSSSKAVEAAHPGVAKRRRRKQSVSLPVSHVVLDYITLFLLLLSAAGSMWVLGGNRYWISGPLTWLLLVAGILGCFRFLISRYRHDVVIPPGGRASLAFLAYLCGILPVAEIPYEALQQLYHILGFVMAYWLWFNLLRINHRWRWALMLTMLSVSIMAWYALILDARGSSMVLDLQRPEQYGMRASGAFICPNHFAHLLHMMILFGLGVLLNRGLGLPLKLFAGYTALISLVPLYLTESRSGWIGLMIGVVVLVAVMALRKGVGKCIALLLISSMMVGALGVAAWYISPRIQARVGQALEGDLRVPLWKDTAAVIRESPWWGNGLGSYRHMYAHFRNHLPMSNDPEFAHNDYLHYWSETGLIGVLLAGLLGVLVLMRALRFVARDKDNTKTSLVAGMLAMMAGSLAHAFFDFNFQIYANVHVFVFLVATTSAATCDEQLDQVVKVGSSRYRAAGWLLAAGLFALLALHTSRLVSYYHEMAGESRMLTGELDDAASEYRRALVWAPGNWRAHVGLGHALRTRCFWLRNPALRDPMIEEATMHYKAAQHQNPWEPDIWYGLGSLYQMRGDKEEALALRQMTVNRIPRHSFYMNALGFQLRDMARYPEALEAFRRSFAVDQNDIARRNMEIMERRIKAQQDSPPGP